VVELENKKRKKSIFFSIGYFRKGKKFSFSNDSDKRVPQNDKPHEGVARR
jgi:hypothetical protein